MRCSRTQVFFLAEENMPPSGVFACLLTINAEGSGEDRPPYGDFSSNPLPWFVWREPFRLIADMRNRLLTVRKIRKPSLRDWH